MSPAAGMLTGRRILLVEDDYFIAVDLKAGFEAGGAEVLGPVPSVAAALAPPGSTRRCSTSTCRTRWSTRSPMRCGPAGVPFLFATGYDSAAVPPPHRAVALCQKPIDPQVVARALFG